MSVPCIETPTPCISCGYDLLNLAEQGRCPECGTPITDSIAGDQLRHADRDWLRTITRGHQLLGIGPLIVVMGGSFVILAGIVVGIAQISPGLETAVELLATGLLIAGMLIAAIGAFLITMLDPRETLRESPWSRRRLARYSMGGLIALAGITEGVNRVIVLGPPLSQILENALFLVQGALVTIAGVNLMTISARILARIPNPPLAARAAASSKRFKQNVPIVWACIFIVDLPLPMPAGGVGISLGILKAALGCAAVIFTFLLIIEAIRVTAIMLEAAGALKRVEA